MKLVVGNWKMHGSLAAKRVLLSLLAGIARAGSVADVAVCAPFPYLSQLQAMLAATPVRWGAQSLSEHASQGLHWRGVGGDAGDFGCRFVIVGHSERRALWRIGCGGRGEIRGCKRAGLIPILCVGETLVQRDAGRPLKRSCVRSWMP